MEMHPNGTQVQKIIGNGYYIVANDSNILVGVDDGELSHNLNIQVYGDVNLLVKGDMIERIEGNYECHVKGDYSLMVEGDSDLLSCGDMRVGANPDTFDFGLGGTLTLSTGDHIYIDGDLEVEGVITGDSIYSPGHITGLCVHAGPQGFVTELGGLAIGPPLAIPGQAVILGNVFVSPGLGGPGTVNAFTGFNTPGYVNCGVLNTPKGNIGVMSAILMTDSVNTGIFDSHVHIGNKGFPTSPSLSPMI
jgi:hypothetical protein